MVITVIVSEYVIALFKTCMVARIMYLHLAPVYNTFQYSQIGVQLRIEQLVAQFKDLVKSAIKS